MNTTIGIYGTHAEGVEALKTLLGAGFHNRQLTLMGKVDEEKNLENKAGTGIGIGAVVGSTLGILTGAGVFLIPGLGFLYGAGALIGAIAGFDFGLIGGGIIAALTLKGVANEEAEKYEQQLKEGKFILVVQGTPEEMNKANDILHKHGTYTSLQKH